MPWSPNCISTSLILPSASTLRLLRLCPWNAFDIGGLGTGSNRETIYTVRYERGASHMLRHRPDLSSQPKYQPSEEDVYWKIGITIADADIARERVIEQSIEVTEPCQFHDLCNWDEPDSYCIELLQHLFANNHRQQTARTNVPLGNEATRGHARASKPQCE